MFSCQITDELASRSKNVTGALRVRQVWLRQQLVNEIQVKDLRQMLSQSEPRDKKPEIYFMYCRDARC
jgi:hypothetical protein